MKNFKNIYDVDLENFQALVIEASHDKTVLVDCWADWCSPCRVIAPVLEQIAEAFDNTLCIAKIEVDEGDNMKIAGQYQVRGFPTLILFINGEEAGRFSGAKSFRFIEDFIHQRTNPE